jgi:protein-disulfide isomerase
MLLRSILTAAAAGLLLSACNADADDAAFGQKVRAYLLAHPEVLEEALTKLQETKTANAASESVKLLAANRQSLIADPRDPVIGDPKAPITVVEFFDYRCGYCKSSTPEVLALVAEQKDVRLVMKEMPILSPQSEQAARLALVAHAQGKYAAVHRALMAERALDEASIKRIASANGVDVAGMNATATTTHLTDVQALAETIGVGGTPAFIVGEQMIAGADMAALRAAIAAARKSAARPG